MRNAHCEVEENGPGLHAVQQLQGQFNGYIGDGCGVCGSGGRCSGSSDDQ